MQIVTLSEESSVVEFARIACWLWLQDPAENSKSITGGRRELRDFGTHGQQYITRQLAAVSIICAQNPRTHTNSPPPIRESFRVVVQRRRQLPFAAVDVGLTYVVCR